MEKIPFIFSTSFLPAPELIEALEKLEVFKACVFLGLALVGLGAYALITLRHLERWRVWAVWVLGVLFVILGLVPSLIQIAWPIQLSKDSNESSSNSSSPESYIYRQVKGTIRTVYVNRSGAMGVLLEVDDKWPPFLVRAAGIKEYEKKNKNKSLGDTYIGSRSIDPNIREFLINAYYNHVSILVTVNGLTADGDWYQLEDAYVGNF